MQIHTNPQDAGQVPHALFAPECREGPALAPWRKGLQHWQPTVVSAPSRNGVEAVRVSLSGKNAKGRSMVLDAEDWNRVEAQYGSRFVLKLSQQGAFAYVFASTKKAVLASGQPKGNGGSSLSRLIVGAAHGEVVRHKDGDNLNLRRANLVVLSHVDAKAFKIEKAIQDS